MGRGRGIGGIAVGSRCSNKAGSAAALAAVSGSARFAVGLRVCCSCWSIAVGVSWGRCVSRSNVMLGCCTCYNLLLGTWDVGYSEVLRSEARFAPAKRKTKLQAPPDRHL
jgi:hypothetical protein